MLCPLYTCEGRNHIRDGQCYKKKTLCEVKNQLAYDFVLSLHCPHEETALWRETVVFSWNCDESMSVQGIAAFFEAYFVRKQKEVVLLFKTLLEENSWEQKRICSH